MVGTGRFELPTPRTPSECSTRLSHVPTQWSRSTEADRLFGVLISLHQMDRVGAWGLALSGQRENGYTGAHASR